jgi:hypothetical protein
MDLARFVGKRTVYPLNEIVAMCRRPVLAILFRLARVLPPAPMSLAGLVAGGEAGSAVDYASSGGGMRVAGRLSWAVSPARGATYFRAGMPTYCSER